jgi:L-lactate dehydrogenase
MKVEEYCPNCGKCADWKSEQKKIEQEVKDSAYHIIGYKGATYFAVGLAIVRIVSAIIRNQKSVLTVSVFLSGEYGINDVCLSVPCIVSGHGIEKLLVSGLPDNEQKLLETSALMLKNAINQLDSGF